MISNFYSEYYSDYSKYQLAMTLYLFFFGPKMFYYQRVRGLEAQEIYETFLLGNLDFHYRSWKSSICISFNQVCTIIRVLVLSTTVSFFMPNFIFYWFWENYWTEYLLLLLYLEFTELSGVLLNGDCGSRMSLKSEDMPSSCASFASPGEGGFSNCSYCQFVTHESFIIVTRVGELGRRILEL